MTLNAETAFHSPGCCRTSLTCLLNLTPYNPMPMESGKLDKSKKPVRHHVVRFWFYVQLTNIDTCSLCIFVWIDFKYGKQNYINNPKIANPKTAQNRPKTNVNTPRIIIKFVRFLFNFSRNHLSNKFQTHPDIPPPAETCALFCALFVQKSYRTITESNQASWTRLILSGLKLQLALKSNQWLHNLTLPIFGTVFASILASFS